MASVFLSYDREDGGVARVIATALEKAGHAVWWDLHVRGGAQFAKVIEEALKAADAVVVLWSKNSVESAWVRDEAGAGRDTNRLVPVTIDGTQPPLGFRQFQTVDVSKSKGRRSKTLSLRPVLDAIEGMAGEPAAPALSVPATAARAFSLRPIGTVAALLLLLALGYLGWQRFDARGSTHLVAVIAATPSPPAPELAKDLVVKLAELQSNGLGSLALADAAQANRADFLFKLGRSLEELPQVNLVLESGKNGTILWSGNFQQESDSFADLKQQVAFTAGRVLACLSEGTSGETQRLEQDSLKMYLNACAGLAILGDSDPQPLLSILRQLIEKKPRFEPAWKRLLLAEAGADRDLNPGPEKIAALAGLRKDIAAARTIDPGMAAVAIAEAIFLPASDFSHRLTLLDDVVRREPDSIDAVSERSGALAAVGRLRESVRDATRAAELDPLSPRARYTAFNARLYSGDLNGARQMMAEVERFWPGSQTLNDMRYRYYLRFGDPKVGLRLAEDRNDSPAATLFLKARIDPTEENIGRMSAYLEKRVRSGEAGPAGSSGLGIFVQALGQFNHTDETLQLLMGRRRMEDLSEISDIYFRPALRGLRSDPRFMIVAQRAGLLKHWQASGKWPDFCFEPDLPYDCKKEAAKLTA